MLDRLMWLHSWKGADNGCKRKLLRNKAVSDLASSGGIKYIDPVAHSLYKIWIAGRHIMQEDIALKSYHQLADLKKDSVPIWKSSRAAARQ